MNQATDTGSTPDSAVGVTPAPAPAPVAAADARPRTSILLVDDQPARLLTYEAVLSGLDVDCVRALSGREALKLLLTREFALILLDVIMPDMDGFETARLIREHPRWERTPIIFVTGMNVSEIDQLKGYEVGAIDYISVPVVPEILRSKVTVLVELHQRRRHLEALNNSLTQARSELEMRHAHALAERDAQLHAIFEHPTESFVVLQAVRDPGGTIVDFQYRDANTNSLELLGYPRDQLLGSHVTDLSDPEEARRMITRSAQVLQTQQVVRYEAQYRDKDFFITLFPMGPECVVSSGTNVTERKRLDAALRQSEARLRDANARKDEFLAMLSHELRNPAAAIGNAAQALSRLAVNRDKEQSLIGIVERQIGHLGHLLDDLLDVLAPHAGSHRDQSRAAHVTVLHRHRA